MTTTLAQIEAETARRLGPYHALTVAADSTETLIYVDDLASTVEQGGKDGLWFLWRTPNSTDDRQRMVKSWNVAEGYLELDRPLGQIPAEGDAIELMAFNPAREVRVAVLAGLRRCYVEDRLTVALAGAAAERDLSAALPWLTEPWQLLDLSWSLGSSLAFAPERVPYWRPFSQGGHVYVDAGAFDPFPYTMYASVLRRADTKINGVSAPPCPVVTDVGTGGSVPADTVEYVALSTAGPYGASPACPPVPIYTATDASNTHVLRCRIAQVAGERYYYLYASAHAAPKRVATITEAQRAAGVTITAQDTISATSPGAGIVDIRVAGTSSAAVPAAAPSNDADVLDVSLEYAAAAGHIEAWRLFKPLLVPLSSSGMTVSQEEAAAEFTNQSRWVAARLRQRVTVDAPVLPDLMATWGHP